MQIKISVIILLLPRAPILLILKTMFYVIEMYIMEKDIKLWTPYLSLVLIMRRTIQLHNLICYYYK